MSTPATPASAAIRLPETTERRLQDFQRLVRRIKLAEGILAGIFGLTLSYVCVFLLDRLIDTPAAIRGLLLLSGALGFGLFFPLKCHRWIWGTRTMEQVATLVKQSFPALGDQLLGVVELARDNASLGTSETLARAAVDHVDSVVRDRDLSDAVPRPAHKKWALYAAVPVGLMLLALLVVPAAGLNALQRWLMPWTDTERYTFAQVVDLPKNIVAPHGEEFTFSTTLAKDSPWTPDEGRLLVPGIDPIKTSRADASFNFPVPPQTESCAMDVRIGDLRKTVDVTVATRPELQNLTARIRLPNYLQYSREVETDVRGGVVSILKGSVASIAAEISRNLTAATVSGQPARITEARIETDAIEVAETQTLPIEWTDHLGLSAREAFPLMIRAVEDEGPNVSLQQLDAQPVVLASDVVSFDLQATDDFGLQEIGLEWKGIPNPLRNPNPEDGDKIVAKGAPEEQSFSTQATFCAERDGVRPQSLEMRAYAEDYKPGRGRVYSPTFVVHVLTPEEHAIWITNQLRRWASLADDVYEEEMRLHDVNRALRRMAPDEINDAKTRRKVEQQAAAERANGQRLNAVTDTGEELIRQAMRNEQMMVGHLETWADSLEALKNIAENRMPNVADLLTAAARAPGQSSPGTPMKAQPGNGTPSDSSPPPQNSKPTAGESSPSDTKPDLVGNNRSDFAKPGSAPQDQDPDKKPSATVPSIQDVESGFNKPDEKESADDQPPSQGGSRLTLPTTTLNGGPSPESDSCPAQQQVNEAVEEQADLLAEFAKVREDLQKIMDDLENSTFVKRLKAASRRQMEIAEDLNRTLFNGFGISSDALKERDTERAEQIAEREVAQSESVWVIQSDLAAYYDRRKQETHLKILEEMEEVQVATQLTAIGDRVRRNMNGESIARAEFWCDTLDRWAEQLVEPSPGGT